MSSENYRIEEYRALRNEIERTFRAIATAFFANMSVAAALIGYGLSAKIGPIFLTPFAITIPSLFYLESEIASITRIATYIMVFIERDSESLNWESRLFEVRQKGLLPRRRKYPKALSVAYALVALTCISLSWFYWRPESRIIWVLIVWPLAVATCLGIIAFDYAFSNDLFKRYSEMWEKLRRTEQS